MRKFYGEIRCLNLMFCHVRLLAENGGVRCSFRRSKKSFVQTDPGEKMKEKVH
jgi:hypothetical protein